MSEHHPEAGDPMEATPPPPRQTLWMGVFEVAGSPARQIVTCYATSEAEARQQLEAGIAEDPRQWTLVDLQARPHGLTIHHTTIPGTR